MRELGDVVQDLLDLRIDYPVSPRLVTELRALPLKSTAKELFRLLQSSAAESSIARVVDALTALRAVDDRWDRVVRKSLSGPKGRCPRELRSRLRSSNTVSGRTRGRSHGRDDGEAPSESTAVAAGADVQRSRSGVLGLGRTRATVRLTVANTGLDGASGMFAALAGVQGNDDVVFDASGAEHLYLPGLAVCAAWCDKTGRHVEVKGATPTVDDYLRRSGFLDAIEGAEHSVPASDRGFRVALERIRERTSVEDVAGRLAGICDEQGFIGRSDKSALIVAFAELIENVQRHAGSNPHGFVGAQFYPTRRKFTAVVADCGMGVQRSFMEGDNIAAAARLRAGEDPLRLAVSPLITSKTQRHSGFGLFVVSELAVKNGGTFSLSSGSHTLTLFSKWGRARSQLRRHAVWPGTVVGMLFDLTQLLPITEVYRSLPLPAGMTEEDFFDDG